MESKISLKWVVPIVLVILVLLFLFIFIFSSKNSSNSPVQSVLTEEKTNIGLPVSLKIPVLDINANIEYVGVTSDGAMEVPEGPSNVAWFSFGPRPGENGSAVIAGHYGWKNDVAAVFDNLDKLQKGDKVYIEDEKGLVTIFIVQKTQIYNENINASKIFYSDDGKAHLNLVTCSGLWNEAKKSRPSRFIVFTDREN